MAATRRIRSSQVALGDSVTLLPARGLTGTVRALPARRAAPARAAATPPPGARRPTLPGDPVARIEAALLENGFTSLQTVEIASRQPGAATAARAARVSGRPARAPQPHATFEIVTEPDQVPVALCETEDGALTWEIGTVAEAPSPARRGARAPMRTGRRTRGRAAPAAAAGKKTWTITVPMRASSAPAAARALRGRAGVARGPARVPLIGGIVKKIIRFFVFTVLDLMGEALLHAIVRKAETRGIHEGFKRVAGDRFPSPKDPPTATWDFMDRGKRILVFIHGTFSNCQGGFADLEGDALAALRQIYGDNILAFDHWTLSKSPLMNANDFMSALPEGGELKLDLVTHSRGGLVARALTETRDQPQVRFERAVFVGTPNAGTPLADPERLKQCLDILTSLFKLLPTFAVLIVIDVLVAVVQWLASRGVGGLPGLVAQNPGSEFLRQLNRPETDTDAVYAAVTANFEPDEGLRGRLMDAGADFLFQKHNDLVVPTESVTSVDPGAAPPPLVAEHTLRFEGSRAHHGNYFAQPSTVSFLLQTLR